MLGSGKHLDALNDNGLVGAARGGWERLSMAPITGQVAALSDIATGHDQQRPPGTSAGAWG